MLWRAEQNIDSELTVAAANLMAVACTMFERDELAHELARGSRAMAERLGFFAVQHDSPRATSLLQRDPNSLRSTSHIAWGAYCWQTYVPYLCLTLAYHSNTCPTDLSPSYCSQSLIPLAFIFCITKGIQFRFHRCLRYQATSLLLTREQRSTDVLQSRGALEE